MAPFPNTALALIPRSLRLAPSTPITRSHLLALYREELRVANSFQSYNFKHYFVRRTRDKFRTELPALLDAAFAQDGSSSIASTSASTALPTATSRSSSSSSSKVAEDEEAGSIYTPSSTPSSPPTHAEHEAAATPEARLRDWYRESLVELGVLARSAIVNRLYEAPKLVVEGRQSQLATGGGGGAGAEAAYGGAGQPADGQPDIPASPAN